MTMRRLKLAPWANKPYHPGLYSQDYHALEPILRQKIADAVDAVFVQKTGVRRKIDEHSRSDLLLVRQWLLIRDAVMAWYLYQKMIIDDRARGLRQRVEAQLQAAELRRGLAETVSARLPKPGEAEEDLAHAARILGPEHAATETVDLIDIAFQGVKALEPVMEVLGPLAVGAALPLTLAAGLADIAEKRTAGDTVLGYQQLRGQNLAKGLLRRLNPRLRDAFLSIYRGQDRYAGQNMDKALHDLGAD